MENNSNDKIFHSYNYKNKDGTRKIIQSGEPCVSVGAKKLYWRRLSKIRRRRDPVKESYFKRENVVINFKASQNQLWYELVSIKYDRKIRN